MTDAEKREVLRRRAAREEKGLSEEEVLDKHKDDDSKRSAMRQALAHRMKMDLLTASITCTSDDTRKKEHAQNQQFLDLEAKLREMDQLREDQSEKESDVAANLRKVRGNSHQKI